MAPQPAVLRCRCWKSSRSPVRCIGGFSLVELVIAMMVGAILLRLGMPSFGNWIGNQRMRTTAEALLHGLNVARSEALRRNARVLFAMPGANGGERAWGVCQVAQGGLACEGAVPTIQVRDGGEESVNARVGATTDPNLVLAAADERRLVVVVNASGGARMCDPRAGAGDPRAC